MDSRAVAIAAAKAASETICERYQKPHERIDKKHLDFATEADVDAERRIVEIISQAFPDHSILAEEVGWAAGGQGSQFTWLIDPLCGTLNFASGVPFFCVNIALLENGQPILGVVAEPLANEILWATSDEGAYLLRSDGQRERLRPNAGTRILALDFGSDPTTTGTEAIVRLLRDVALKKQFTVRMFSSSLMFPYLARGTIAAVANTDTAALHMTAGAFICQQAGCMVTGAAGAPWTPECRGVLAAADPSTHSLLRSLITSSK